MVDAGKKKPRLQHPLQLPPHHPAVHIHPAPQPDRDRALVDQHAQAVEHGAAGGFGGPDQVGTRWVGDRVGDHHAGAQRGPVEVELVVDMREQPDRGRVDHDAGAGRDRHRGVPVLVLGAGRGFRVDQVGQLLPVQAASVDHRDVRRAGQGQFHRHRASCPARAEQQHALPLDLAHGAQRLHKPLAVGVLADQQAIAGHHGVDRADDLRRRREVVQVLDHRHLVRQRAVEAGPAHGAGAAHRVGQLLGRHLAVDVAPMQAVVPVGGFDHRHGRVLGGRLGEGAGQAGQEVHGIS